MNIINGVVIIDYNDILIKEISNNQKKRIKQLNKVLIELRKKYKIISLINKTKNN